MWPCPSTKKKKKKITNLPKNKNITNKNISYLRIPYFFWRTSSNERCDDKCDNDFEKKKTNENILILKKKKYIYNNNKLLPLLPTITYNILEFFFFFRVHVPGCSEGTFRRASLWFWCLLNRIRDRLPILKTWSYEIN